MRSVKNILLSISLLPFLFIIYLCSLNTNKQTNIKFLVWEFNEQNIASMLLLGSSFGFSLSALNAYFLSSNSRAKKTRVTKSIPNYKEPIFNDDNSGLINEDFENSNSETDNYYLERDIREPSPTVSVPYKIIRRVSNENNNSAKNYDSSYSKNQPKEYDLDRKNSSMNNEDWALIDLEQW